MLRKAILFDLINPIFIKKKSDFYQKSDFLNLVSPLRNPIEAKVFSLKKL